MAVILAAAASAAALPGSFAPDSSAPNENDTLFQTSTIGALMTGVFDGTMSFKDLRSHGDFGVGTFNRLDGEMVELDGQFYQVKSDGSAYPVDGSMKTPFAEVTFFKPDETASLNSTYNLTQLQSYLDGRLPTKNLFYAIRIDGTFDYIKTRAPLAQDKPYPTLTEALKSQKIFQFQNVTGTVVGVWCPSYAKEINVAGYHMHFITADRSKGGHLLDLTLSKNATVQIDDLSGLQMALPLEEEFYQADLSGDQQAALKKAESNPK